MKNSVFFIYLLILAGSTYLIRVIPSVSYTHLDVYKRQVQAYPHHVRIPMTCASCYSDCRAYKIFQETKAVLEEASLRYHQDFLRCNSCQELHLQPLYPSDFFRASCACTPQDQFPDIPDAWSRN